MINLNALTKNQQIKVQELVMEATLKGQAPDLKSIVSKVLEGSVRPKEFTIEISQKTGVVVFKGLGRYPVSLYANQWKELIENIGAIKEFLDENKELLKDKSKTSINDKLTQVFGE